jgi:hypothetical protein
MSLSILQSLEEVNPSVTFADSQSQFTQAKSTVSELNISLAGIEEFKQNFRVPDISFAGVTDTIQSLPLSANELSVELTARLDKLRAINLESLQAVIPDTPGVEYFQDINIGDINQVMNNLTQSLIGDFNIGNIENPRENTRGAETSDLGEAILADFQEFLTKAGTLPSRILDAFLKVVKRILDKLSNPDELLQLNAAALTDIFSDQINAIEEKLPSKSIAIITENISKRRELIAQRYTGILEQLNTSENLTALNKEKIKTLRQEVKKIESELEQIDNTTTLALKNLQEFDISKFQETLAKFPQEDSNPNAWGLKPLFDTLNQYISGLNERIATITRQLEQFVKKIGQVIQQGIAKAGEIATKITQAITEKIEEGKQILKNLSDYLQEIIAKIKKFVEETATKSTELVKPIKQAINTFSQTAIPKIDEFSQTIKEQTEKIRQAVKDVNQQIESKLNRQELEKKINELLDKITALLDSPQVKEAVQQVDRGIQVMVDSLQKVTLKPAFQTVVSKTGELENKLKAVDVSRLSTIQKTALKVGTEIIKEVDIPGVVNPELKAAFEEILNPLANIVELVQGEFNNIDQKIAELKPGTLAEQFLTPYINALIEELNKYKPSQLLQPVYNLYQELLKKLDILDPKQLLVLLEELYNKLVQVIESLSPQSLANFLNQKLQIIAEELDKLPIEALIQKATDSLNQIDKLMASLGLTDVLKSDFWLTLEDILSFNFQNTIDKVDEIKQKIVNQLNQMDGGKLRQQIEQMKNTIQAYVNTPSLATDISQIEEKTTQFAEAVTQLQTRWNQQKNQLEQFTPPLEIDVDYRDLLQRLQSLYEQLIVNKPQDVLTQIQGIVSTDSQRLQANEAQRNALLETSQTKSTEQIITNFKAIIPDEIEREIVNPIKEILTALDNLIVQPRSILDEVKKVIQSLEDAPRQLALILKSMAESLGGNIRGAINAVKDAITSLNFNFLVDIHRTLTETVKSLSPRSILNFFYDESDFKNFNSLLQKLQNPTDTISRYLKEQLPGNVQLLLAGTDSPGKNQAIMKALNEQMKNANFYSVERFQGITLSVETQVLIAKKQQLSEQELIHLNRLLLEAAYPQEIVMNVESIYPYIKTKLGEIYPTTLILELDNLHGKIIQLISDIPKALGSALDKQYQDKVVTKVEQLKASINQIFEALLKRLKGLESELDIGLEDVSDAFNRLLTAIPV